MQALSRSAPGGGGDGPESLIEALYQLATGAGFDGDNDGSMLESGLAGMVGTQTNPGSSGDVPPFLPGSFEAYRNNAIPLDLDVTTNVPAITNSSTFAFKFNVTAGDSFRFIDTASAADTGQWLLVNEAGRVISTHRRGQSFIEPFEITGQILLIPARCRGLPNRPRYVEPVFSLRPLSCNLAKDTQFAFANDGDRQRYTFTLTEPTPVIFDAVSAEVTTTWTLSDGSGSVFSSRMYAGSSLAIHPWRST